MDLTSSQGGGQLHRAFPSQNTEIWTLPPHKVVDSYTGPSPHRIQRYGPYLLTRWWTVTPSLPLTEYRDMDLTSSQGGGQLHRAFPSQNTEIWTLPPHKVVDSYTEPSPHRIQRYGPYLLTRWWTVTPSHPLTEYRDMDLTSSQGGGQLHRAFPSQNTEIWTLPPHKVVDSYTGPSPHRIQRYGPYLLTRWWTVTPSHPLTEYRDMDLTSSQGGGQLHRAFPSQNTEIWTLPPHKVVDSYTEPSPHRIQRYGPYLLTRWWTVTPGHPLTEYRDMDLTSSQGGGQLHRAFPSQNTEIWTLPPHKVVDSYTEPSPHRIQRYGPYLLTRWWTVTPSLPLTEYRDMDLTSSQGGGQLHRAIPSQNTEIWTLPPHKVVDSYTEPSPHRIQRYGPYLLTRWWTVTPSHPLTEYRDMDLTSSQGGGQLHRAFPSQNTEIWTLPPHKVVDSYTEPSPHRIQRYGPYLLTRWWTVTPSLPLTEYRDMGLTSSQGDGQLHRAIPSQNTEIWTLPPHKVVDSYTEPSPHRIQRYGPYLLTRWWTVTPSLPLTEYRDMDLTSSQGGGQLHRAFPSQNTEIWTLPPHKVVDSYTGPSPHRIQRYGPYLLTRWWTVTPGLPLTEYRDMDLTSSQGGGQLHRAFPSQNTEIWTLPPHRVVDSYTEPSPHRIQRYGPYLLTGWWAVTPSLPLTEYRDMDLTSSQGGGQLHRAFPSQNTEIWTLPPHKVVDSYTGPSPHRIQRYGPYLLTRWWTVTPGLPLTEYRDMDLTSSQGGGQLHRAIPSQNTEIWTLPPHKVVDSYTGPSPHRIQRYGPYLLTRWWTVTPSHPLTEYRDMDLTSSQGGGQLHRAIPSQNTEIWTLPPHKVMDSYTEPSPHRIQRYGPYLLTGWWAVTPGLPLTEYRDMDLTSSQGGGQLHRAFPSQNTEIWTLPPHKVVDSYTEPSPHRIQRYGPYLLTGWWAVTPGLPLTEYRDMDLTSSQGGGQLHRAIPSQNTEIWTLPPHKVVDSYTEPSPHRIQRYGPYLLTRWWTVTPGLPLTEYRDMGLTSSQGGGQLHRAIPSQNTEIWTLPPHKVVDSYTEPSPHRIQRYGPYLLTGWWTVTPGLPLTVHMALLPGPTGQIVTWIGSWKKKRLEKR